MSTISDKPTIDLNLDTLAAESDSTPYRVTWKGKVYELQHASTLDAFEMFDAMNAGEPTATIETLRLGLGQEKFDEFRKARPPLGVMQATVRGWLTHSGMGGSGN